MFIFYIYKFCFDAVQCIRTSSYQSNNIYTKWLYFHIYILYNQIKLLKTDLFLQNITDIQNPPEYPPILYRVQYHLPGSPSPHRIPIRKHHICISFVVPPYKYINAQPILLLYLCYYVILICIFHFILSAKVYSSIFSIIFFKASADSLSFNASSPFKLIGTSDSTPFAPTIAGILNETPSMSYIP